MGATQQPIWPYYYSQQYILTYKALNPTLQGFYLYSKTYLEIWFDLLIYEFYCNMYWGGRREERFHWENFCNISNVMLLYDQIGCEFLFIYKHICKGRMFMVLFFPHPLRSLGVSFCEFSSQMLHPILQFENILHFFLFGDHVDINGNHYYEKKKPTLKSYVWCMLHPILQFKKHQSLLGQDHQWLNCYYFSRYHEELWMHQNKQMTKCVKKYNKRKVVFNWMFEFMQKWNQLNGTHWKI